MILASGREADEASGARRPRAPAHLSSADSSPMTDPTDPPSDPSDRQRLFLTGGTGLVGSHVAELWTERGWTVRCLVRPHSDTRHLEELGCELVIGDLTRPESFRGAADGCAVAVHSAAVLGSDSPWKKHRAVNVAGTQHVVAECLRAGVRRLVHLSSVAVYGHPADHSRLPIDEGSPTDVPVPDCARYERSKRRAEQVVRRSAGPELEWTMLRPEMVMGERDRELTPRVVRHVRRPVVPRVGDGGNGLPVVYAGNVALAAWSAAESPEAAGRAYNVTDGGTLTQRELLEEARRTVDAGGPVIPIPEALLRGGVRALGSVSELLPRRLADVARGRHLWFLANDDPFDGSRLRRELGWEPATDASDGWRRSLEWRRRVERAGAAG